MSDKYRHRKAQTSWSNLGKFSWVILAPELPMGWAQAVTASASWFDSSLCTPCFFLLPFTKLTLRPFLNKCPAPWTPSQSASWKVNLQQPNLRKTNSWHLLERWGVWGYQKGRSSRTTWSLPAERSVPFTKTGDCFRFWWQVHSRVPFALGKCIRGEVKTHEYRRGPWSDSGCLNIYSWRTGMWTQTSTTWQSWRIQEFTTLLKYFCPSTSKRKDGELRPLV